MQSAAPDLPCRGPQQPRMDNFAGTCRNPVRLRPRHCNMLQHKHASPPSPMNHPPLAGYAIQVRIPPTTARPRPLSDRGEDARHRVQKHRRSRSRGFQRCPKGTSLSFLCLCATGDKVAKCCKSWTRRTATPAGAAGGREAGCGAINDHCAITDGARSGYGPHNIQEHRDHLVLPASMSTSTKC